MTLPPSHGTRQARHHPGARTLALCTVFVACSDEGKSVLSNPEELTGAGKGSCPSEITSLIASLFPGALKNAAMQQCQNVERALSAGDLEEAIAKVFDLIVFALGHYEDGSGSG